MKLTWKEWQLIDRALRVAGVAVVKEWQPFKECAECAKKSGSPTLCDNCLNSRMVAEKLHREAEQSAHEMNLLRKKIEQAGLQ